MKVALGFSDTPSFVAPNVPGPLTNTQLAMLWLDWVAELGGCHSYDLVLLAPPNATLPESVQAWRSVIRLQDRNQVSAWPQGPNLSFQQILWWQLLNKIEEPIFWVEADAIPLRTNWVQEWEAEYLRGKKPFMGGLVAQANQTPAHMTGNAIYPPYAGKFASKLLEAKNTAFDVWASPEILPQLHPTNLIQHLWRHPPIERLSQYRGIVDEHANLFHSDKFGAIIKLLRSQRPHQAEEPGEIIRQIFGTEASPGEVNTPEGLASITKTPEPEPEPPPEAEEEEPVMPKAFAMERLFQRIRDLVITEEDRKRLLEFLRDEHFFTIRTPDRRGKVKKKPVLAGHAK